VWFELRNEEDDSDDSTEYEEEVEQLTSVIRRSKRERKPVERYSLSNFHSAFMLISIDDEPIRSMRQLTRQRLNSGRMPWSKIWNLHTRMRHGT
jgi:hypothetical protein